MAKETVKSILSKGFKYSSGEKQLLSIHAAINHMYGKAEEVGDTVWLLVDLNDALLEIDFYNNQ